MTTTQDLQDLNLALKGEYVIVDNRRLRAGRQPEGAGIEVLE